MKSKTSLRQLCYIALSAALLALSAWLAVPTAVPFTLQTLAVALVAGLLGWKRGTAAVICYILLGAVGLPVFSGFRSGVGALLSSTGGYIAGFVPLALCVGLCSDKWGARPVPLALAAAAGMLLCYGLGTAWFMYVYARDTGAVGLGTALGWCVIPYIIPDAVKLALAIYLTGRLKPIIIKST